MPHAFRAAWRGGRFRDVALLADLFHRSCFLIGIPGTPAQASGELQIVLIKADGRLAVIDVADSGEPSEVADDPSGDGKFGDEGETDEGFDRRLILEGLDEAGVFGEDVLEALPEPDGGVFAREPTLTLPVVTRTSLQGEFAAITSPEAVAKGGCELVAVVEVRDFIVGEGIHQTEIPALGQIPIELQSEAEGVAGREASTSV